MSLSFSSRTAYLLVTHGSRDPRPAIAAQALARQVAVHLERSPVLQQDINGGHFSTGFSSQNKADTILVGTACLELAPMPLHQQIVEFSDRALQLGYSTLLIVPLFLLPGIHVREDIPQEVAIAQRILSQTASHKMDLHICPYLGSAPGIAETIQNPKSKIQNSTTPLPPTILLAHGSRRPGGNRPIEAIATQLGAHPAYWSVSPGLETQIQQLSQQGHNHITVIPYFLFAGGITDAIAQMVGEISDRYPHLTLILGQPLGARDDIVRLIINLVEATQ
ncbi:MAG: sirohydrochlorin chelatase, partial [Merismopedia sp. SIO2A8]|nr:sirohydrochlorin chelatase [Merismopedia sp. SIO2A8]